MRKGNPAAELTERYQGHPDYNEIIKRAGLMVADGSTREEIENLLQEQYSYVDKLKMKSLSAYTLVGQHDQETMNQIHMVSKLPVTLNAALMPDGHVGYAMPIGGVADLKDAISPSLVGNDIGCAMQLTILSETVDEFQAMIPALFQIMKEQTVFGIGKTMDQDHSEHEIFQDPRWYIDPVKNFKSLAISQLGTSGSGNHFVELVIGQCLVDDSYLPMTFGALLSHSGSRGLGQAIAKHYQDRAKKYTRHIADVPSGYEWLDIHSQEGRDYHSAMLLAVRYSMANHDVIHRKILLKARQELGLKPRHSLYECTHNYAQCMPLSNSPAGQINVRHRKGAIDTTCTKIGIIPGSMGTASYLVLGLGHKNTLESASHGAGRNFSRTEAKKRTSPKAIKDFMDKRGILYNCLPLDESPFAYKDIDKIIKQQVDIGMIQSIAHMTPVAVVMNGE